MNYINKLQRDIMTDDISSHFDPSPFIIKESEFLIKEFTIFVGDVDLSKQVAIRSALKHLELLKKIIPGDKEIIDNQIIYIKKTYHH